MSNGTSCKQFSVELCNTASLPASPALGGGKGFFMVADRSFSVHFFVGGVAELYHAWITGALPETPLEIAESAADIVESSSLFFRRK